MFNPALLPSPAAYGKSWEPVAESWTSVGSSPIETPSEDCLSTSTLVDLSPADIAVQTVNFTRGRKDSVTSPKTFEDLTARSPMSIRSDVDLCIQDVRGGLIVYPVFACDHVTGTDLVILDPTVLDHLEGISADKDEKLNVSSLRIKELEKKLRRTERQKSSAVQEKECAQKAEAQASSALDVTRQERSNALIEVQLLQQALQLAQRGYHDTKEEVTVLRKDVERTHENNEKLHQNTEALHEIFDANKVEMINLRKDHEFARTQSKGYLNATQQSIQGHEAARMQLLEQMSEERALAAQKIAEVERRNVELEEMLAVKMHAIGQSSNGDCYIDMTHTGPSDTNEQEDQDEDRRNGWFNSWRIRRSNSVRELEDGLRTQPNTASVDTSVDMASPGIPRSNWGVKSLRSPGVWGGRSKGSLLPK